VRILKIPRVIPDMSETKRNTWFSRTRTNVGRRYRLLATPRLLIGNGHTAVGCINPDT